MTRDELVEKVKEIIIDELGVEAKEVTMEADFVNDLKADSLDTVELFLRIEEEFGIEEIPEEEALKISTVGSAVDYLEKLVCKE